MILGLFIKLNFFHLELGDFFSYPLQSSIRCDFCRWQILLLILLEKGWLCLLKSTLGREVIYWKWDQKMLHRSVISSSLIYSESSCYYYVSVEGILNLSSGTGYFIQSCIKWKGARVIAEGPTVETQNFTNIFWYSQRNRGLFGKEVRQTLWSCWWGSSKWLAIACSLWSIWWAGKSHFIFDLRLEANVQTK